MSRLALLILFRSCLLMSVFVSISVGWAAPNPFGTPEPIDPARPGAVVLHGGGHGLSREICWEFVRLAGGDQARIVLIPSEDYQFGQDEDGNPLEETPTEFERRVLGVYTRWEPLVREGRAANVRVLFQDPVGDPHDRRLDALLEEATGVWMPAADPSSLPARFASEYPGETSRFQLALRRVVARGGVVGGLGGGMSCLSETVIAQDLDDDDGWQRAQLRFGLALLNGVVLDQNFDQWAGRLERMSELLRNGPTIDRSDNQPGVERRTIGIGVDRHTAVILQANTARVMGVGHGHFFLKSNGDRTVAWRQIEAGDDPITINVHRQDPLRHDAHREPPAGFNPFGLPEPRDPERPGTVVLYGGGSTGEISAEYPSLAKSPSPKLVVCPAALARCRPSGDNRGQRLQQRLNSVFGNWVSLENQQRVESIEFITTNDANDANRDAFLRPLKNADAVWFGGGDQNDLSALFVNRAKPTQFQKDICDVVARGGVVGGSSAGLSIMSEIMIGSGQSIDDKPARAELSFGLGVLRHVIAEQHFDARRGRIERLTGVLWDHKRFANLAPDCDPRSFIGLAVEENTALILTGRRMRVSGKNMAHIFVQSRRPHTLIWHALNPGDHAVMSLQGDELVLSPEDWNFE